MMSCMECQNVNIMTAAENIVKAVRQDVDGCNENYNVVNSKMRYGRDSSNNHREEEDLSKEI